MKPMSILLLWSLLASVLVVAEDGEAAPYAVFYLWSLQQGGFWDDGRRLNTKYRGVAALGKSDDENGLPNIPNSAYKWVFWDASSVRFKMGFPSSDFSSLAPMASAIRSAIASWDNIDASVLSITYNGMDIYLTNNPNDGINTIFWSNHSSISDANGYTLLTTPTSGVDLGEFSDVDIVLNDGRHWTTTTARCGATYEKDVQSVVTHELGHALGLGHSTGPNTMTSSTGSTGWCANNRSAYENLGQRTITANDRAGYRYIYVGSNSIRSLFGGDGQSSKIAVGDAPKESGVTQASVFPNPFNPEVTLAFELTHSASVGVRIYNELGQQVRVLAAEGIRPAGSYQFVWDGRDHAGQFQASGTYFLVLAVDGAVETHKLTLLH